MRRVRVSIELSHCTGLGGPWWPAVKSCRLARHLLKARPAIPSFVVRRCMSQRQPNSTLEIDRAIEFQRTEWRVQRIGWFVMALMVLAALAGLTGNGMLARATAGGPPDPVRLEYGRFERLRAPATLTVEIAGGAITGERVELWIERTYLRGVSIESIVPEPREVRAAANGLIYVFAADDPGYPLTIAFDLRHADSGRKSGRVALVDAPAISFDQFVYP
jgi:hypothetical protein